MKRKQRAKVVLGLIGITPHYLGLIPTRCGHNLKEKVNFSSEQCFASEVSEMRIIHFTWLFHLFLHFSMISLIIFLFLALTTHSLIYLYSNWPQQYHLLSTTSTITIVEVICTQTDTLKYLNKCVSKELLISFLITNYCCHSSPLEPFDNFQQLHCFHDNQEYY